MPTTSRIADVKEQYYVLAERGEATERDTLEKEKEGTQGRGEVCPAFWGNFSIVRTMRGESRNKCKCLKEVKYGSSSRDNSRQRTKSK